ncbi:putative methyltransferase [Rhodococcus coprophilus]|uniref:Putative methyltransferase n=2 Tax=Rhodococcus coprophilus TaxID=38310 RepID=A0A2X4TME3_9NOCA|nr:putative methyltransferase [Rhodococcus coprophilus]
MTSPDLTNININKLTELFPSVVTETLDADGNPKRAIDFDLLRQELSDHVVEGPQERYRLDWPGKRAAAFAANAPIAKTLRPVREESVDFDTTQNLFIEGDNLDALKLLQESYLGKIKLIYIDPPYNTGNDFVYNDDFAETTDEYLLRSGQTDESGASLVANPESNGRFHSDWLSMLYPRLKLARNLLTDDGVLVISIDDNESANLRKIGDEIFGTGNFVAQVAVQVNPRGRHLDRFVAKTHESLMIFVRNSAAESITGIAKEGRMADEYQRSDDGGPFRLLGLRNRNQAFNPQTRPNLYFPLYVEPSTGRVSTELTAEFHVEVFPDAPDGTQTCWTWGRERILRDNALLTAETTGAEWRIFRKDYLYGVDGKVAKTLVKSVWLDGEFTNDYGRKAVKDLFGGAVMDFPKSPQLMKRLLEIAAGPECIILDFFAGSSSMAHAVMMANLEDGGRRQFVMVQLDEHTDPNSTAADAGYSTIAELSRERIRRAGASVAESAGLAETDLDIGFRSLHVDSTNMADVLRSPDATDQLTLTELETSVKPDRSGEDLLFQVMLDWGLELTMEIAIEQIDGQEVFVVEDGALIACFDSTVKPELVRTIAEREPLRAVFRDSSFASDDARINAEQVFRELSPATDVKAI